MERSQRKSSTPGFTEAGNLTVWTRALFTDVDDNLGAFSKSHKSREKSAPSKNFRKTRAHYAFKTPNLKSATQLTKVTIAKVANMVEQTNADKRECKRKRRQKAKA